MSLILLMIKPLPLMYRRTISQRAQGATLPEQTDWNLIVLSNKDKKLVTKRRHLSPEWQIFSITFGSQ